MGVAIIIPAVGESIVEGIVAKWHKADGEWVNVGDHLMDFETDKITQEILADAAGVLKHSANEEDTVAIGATVGEIDTDAEKPAGAPADEGNEAYDLLETAPVESEAAKPETAPSLAITHSVDFDKIKASPAARTLILENKLDPESIKATGRGGVITKPDVLKALESGSAKQSAPPAEIVTQPKIASPSKSVVSTTDQEGNVTRKKMSPLRATIAKRLLEAKNGTAMLTTFNEVDLSTIMHIRKKYQDQFVNRYDVKLGFMSFFVKAVCDALKMYPAVNSILDENFVEYRHYYNVGIAVGTEKGLFVPVIRDADKKCFADIEIEIKDFAVRAKANKIQFSELQGGTFTITNGGVYGSMLSTPILNPPQVAILGMHNIVKRAMVVNENGKDEIQIRPMMYLALSYDHRVIDGKDSIGFLIRLKDCLENPERMLLEL